MSAPLISLDKVRLVQGGKTLCSSLDLHILPGQVWGVLGANGAGKTTLLHAVAGLYKPAAGVIRLLERHLDEWPRRELAQQLGVLLQDQGYSFPARVRELVLQGRHPHQSLWQRDSLDDCRRVEEALMRVDLYHLADRRVDQLSGGERQRLAIASLMAQGAGYLILDEPTNHLDLHYQVELMGLLIQQAHQLNGFVLASLHDLNLAARFCSHLLLFLGDGEVAAGPLEEMLAEAYLHRLYKHCIVKIESGNGRAFLPG